MLKTAENHAAKIGPYSHLAGQSGSLMGFKTRQRNREGSCEIRVFTLDGTRIEEGRGEVVGSGGGMMKKREMKLTTSDQVRQKLFLSALIIFRRLVYEFHGDFYCHIP